MIKKGEKVMNEDKEKDLAEKLEVDEHEEATDTSTETTFQIWIWLVLVLSMVVVLCNNYYYSRWLVVLTIKILIFSIPTKALSRLFESFEIDNFKMRLGCCCIEYIICLLLMG